MNFNVPLNNFSSGEWSPKMRARTDVEQYPRSCTEMTNFITQMQGGAFRRPGTMFLSSAPVGHLGGAGDTIDFSKEHRLFPYTSPTGVGFIIIAGRTVANARLWLAYNVETAAYATIPALTNLPTLAAYSTYDYQQVGGVLVFTNNGDSPFMVYNDGTYAAGAGWLLGRFLDTIGWPDRVGMPQWKSYAYGDVEALGSSGTLTATGVFTVGSGITLAATANLFEATDAWVALNYRTFIKVTAAGVTGVIGITTVTNATTAAGTVMEVLPGASPQAYGLAAGTSFQMSRWRGTTRWPKRVTAYQGRLIFGSSGAFPDTLWGSRIGNVFDFDEIPLAQSPDFTGFDEDNSRPFELTPNSPEQGIIQSLTSAKTLVICTNNAELVAYGTQGALGPNDFQIETSTSFGSRAVRPARTNNFLTIVQKTGRKIRDFIFNDTESQYKANDLSFVADHMTKGTYIEELASIQGDSSIMYARLASGEIIGVTLDREYQVNAWFRLRLGGEGISGAAYEYPQCTALTSVYNYTTRVDELFMVVKRTINSAVVYSFEKLSQPYEESEFTVTTPTSETAFPHYVDAWEAQTGASSTTWTFANKPSAVVSVLADGLYVGEKTLSAGGVLTLTRAATSVHVGYAYASTLKPALLEQGGAAGSSVGRPKRATDLYLRFFNTYGCRFGSSAQMEDVVFSRGTTPGNEPVPFFTGDVDVKNVLGYSKAYQIVIETDYPFPCNVLALGVKGASYD